MVRVCLLNKPDRRERERVRSAKATEVETEPQATSAAASLGTLRTRAAGVCFVKRGSGYARSCMKETLKGYFGVLYIYLCRANH